ncbi:ankyrin repeat-containing protein P16F5.05c [Diplogelasinospora grovesii]|uniref:Ankyrin repeat-containing protein P16F5.05c n=1 Tax=Diplogelasinospora grovesii TaxID=303347 RepID=A0AAN6NB21_9PEZI|nr:ankyrin repeat-containing protein P16F5.05c [Diplogelasinospora grovesii]
MVNLSEEEIDDLLYFSRAGEISDLRELLKSLAERENVSPAEILISAKDQGKSTCLHMATGNGHIDIIKFLLDQFSARPAAAAEKHAFLDAPNEYGNTGLHWAALGGHLDAVKLLVEAGASPALANDKNYVPLDLASFGDKMDVVDYFLSKMPEEGEDEDEDGKGGSGGLEKAVEDVNLNENDGGEEEVHEGKAKGKEVASS